MDKYEEIAREYIEGMGGLFDLYKYELASPKCNPPEVEGARWMLRCLVQPANRATLDALVNQANLRVKSARPPCDSPVRRDADCLTCPCNNCDVSHADLECKLVNCIVTQKPECPGQNGDCLPRNECIYIISGFEIKKSYIYPDYPDK